VGLFFYCFGRRLEHPPSPCGVNVQHVNTVAHQGPYGPGHGVGYIVELQVGENPPAPFFNPPDRLRPCGRVQFQTHLKHADVGGEHSRQFLGGSQIGNV